MMKFNFGCGPLVLKGKSYNEGMTITVKLEEFYDDIPMKVIEDVAEKLYSVFDVSCVSLYTDDICICTIDKKEEDE